MAIFEKKKPKGGNPNIRRIEPTPRKPPSKTNKLLLYFLVMSPLMFGACLGLFVGGVGIAEYISSQGWEPATAQITQSSLGSRYSEKIAGRRGGCNCWLYWAQIRYSYSANGQQFSSNRMDFEDQICVSDMCLGSEGEGDGYTATEDQAEVHAILARYPQGSQATIYYNPNKPQNAVLERTLPVTASVIGGISLVIFLLALGAVFGLGRRAR